MSMSDNGELVFDHVSTPEGIPTMDTDVYVNRTDDSAVYENNDSLVESLDGLSPGGSLPENSHQSVEENGRTYHKFKEGKYPLPNDVKEQERLDLQHEMLRIALRGKLYLAPIGKPKQVMDVATGTGKWAIEFANQHPTSQVLGTDLSAIQPTTNVSPNIRWEIEDAEDEWIYKSQFDYIHARAVMSCFKDHSAVLRSIFEALTPGGWFELQDAIMPMQYMGPTPTSSALYK